MAETTIGISRETWKELNARKEVGDSFEDVLRRVLGLKSIKDNEKVMISA